jgi:hypothetical protein
VKRSITAMTAVIVLLALAGCGPDPQPKEPSGKAIPIPSPPAAASQDTTEGRAAFAAHFINLVNYTAMTGDTKPLLAISDGCTQCRKLATTTSMVRIDGHRPTQGIWKAQTIESLVGGTRTVVTISAQPALGVQGFELGLVTTASPPYRVRDIGQLQ